MTKDVLWVGESGTKRVGDMHENHLMNAYAKSVRENDAVQTRPALAAEILDRGISDRLPDYAMAALTADAPQAYGY